VFGQLGLQLPAGIPSNGGAVSLGTGIGTGGIGTIGTGTGSCSVCGAATGLGNAASDLFGAAGQLGNAANQMFNDMVFNFTLNSYLGGGSIYKSQKKYIGMDVGLYLEPFL